MAVYTGDRFPAWKGNVFVGSMRVGGIPGPRPPGTHRVQREDRRAAAGPDGFLYLLTDEDAGALLRIEPS
jgi:glucose/arabinose dehydrogenase